MGRRQAVGVSACRVWEPHLPESDKCHPDLVIGGTGVRVTCRGMLVP